LSREDWEEKGREWEKPCQGERALGSIQVRILQDEAQKKETLITKGVQTDKPHLKSMGKHAATLAGKRHLERQLRDSRKEQERQGRRGGGKVRGIKGNHIKRPASPSETEV